jgi:hypothetical protein
VNRNKWFVTDWCNIILHGKPNQINSTIMFIRTWGKLGAKSNRPVEREVSRLSLDKEGFATHSTMSLGCMEEARVTTNMHSS